MRAMFELGKVQDVPRFEGMAYEDVPSVLQRKSKFYLTDSIGDDFFPEMPYTWNWEIESLTKKWQVFEASGNVAPFNDFPCLGLNIPAFSERACDALRDFLEPNGELLPVRSNGQNYFVYNCLKIVEILDHANTVGAFMTPYSPAKDILNIATSISYMSLKDTGISNLSIFRLRELPNRTFVSDKFVTRVGQFGLNGFDFKKCWPMQKGSDYLVEHLLRKKMTPHLKSQKNKSRNR